MRSDQASRTAMATAFLRALHLVVDEPPHVFVDDLAAAFLAAPQRHFLERLGAMPRRWVRTFRQRRSALGSMRAQVLVRARITEDAFAHSTGDGRYLVMSAGLDTFAWRAADRTREVVEIDHPATQNWKRSHLAGLGRHEPVNTRFVPIDFERQSLASVLDRPSRPQFVSWLGTTYYLTREALVSTLSALAEASPAGSRLVLDYWSDAPGPADSSLLLWGTRIATATQFEPMRSFLGPAEMDALARETGWQVRRHWTAAEQNERYLHGRDDDLRVPAFAYVAELGC